MDLNELATAMGTERNLTTALQVLDVPNSESAEEAVAKLLLEAWTPRLEAVARREAQQILRSILYEPTVEDAARIAARWLERSRKNIRIIV